LFHKAFFLFGLGGTSGPPARRGPFFLRPPVHRSPLVRQLAASLPAATDLPRQDLAERLGDWLNVRDAIALNAAHQALPRAAAQRPATARTAGPGLRAALQALRTTLEQGIAAPPALPLVPGDTSFAPTHQRWLAQQRRMETAIDALRQHARQTLAASSPALAQLALLDAALDQWLGGREQRLLADVPAFLKQRFEQLRQQQPDTWPTAFEGELQSAMRAELDLRLQPLTGLVEAFEQAGPQP